MLVFSVRSQWADGALHMPFDQLQRATGLAFRERSGVTPDASSELTEYIQTRLHARGSQGPWHIVLGAPRMSELGGQPYVTVPLTMRASIPARHEALTLNCDVILREIVSHDVHVYRSRTSDGSLQAPRLQLAGTFNYARSTLTISVEAASAQGFADTVGMGMVHVLEGLDHLLFLAMLLLPAPLVAISRRWSGSRSAQRTLARTAQVVTAFTVGHSASLAAVTLSGASVGGRWLETLIAMSVAASAVHAMRPLVRGGEVLLAGSFGLVHGLAFAGLLREFGGGVGAALQDLLAFNLGVELAQLLVVAAVVPSLLVLSAGTRYHIVRRTAGAAGLVAAVAWTVERATGLTTPLRPALNALASTPEMLAIALAVIAGLDVVFRPRVRIDESQPSSATSSVALSDPASVTRSL
ncbi:HupE/UreJ family protein [Streptomyces pseudogriseolus]|uniref:HupE/UreJ family protein n=1 Tax=Streptomyces pseudogriseolus TaxID=36817 RepID=UPI003FA1B4B4